MAQATLLKGNILTSGKSQADFLLIEGETVSAVGPTEEMKAYLGDEIRTVELGDCVALPGLMDSHVHLVQTGLSCLNVDLTTAKDKDHALSLLAEEAVTNPELVCGFGFDESAWLEGELLTLPELDCVSKTIPIFVSRRDSHLFVANTPAVKKFAPALEDEPLNDENTRLGIFRGELGYKLQREVFLLISEERKEEGVRLACEKALRRGITAIQAMEGGKFFGEGNIKLIQRLSPTLPQEIIVFPQITDCDAVERMGLPRIGGCIMVDGSIGARTAALYKPYSDQAENCGVLYFSDEELFAFTGEANRRDLQIALHAIGDRAIAQTLEAYRRALDDHPRKNHRLRIEHFELGTDEQIEQCAELDMVIAMQPNFERLWGGAQGMYAKRLGQRPTNRLATIVRAGVVVAGGSDSNITLLDSLLGIASALSHPNPRERLSFSEALALFTENCAYAGFQEDIMGTLEVGKRANITILHQDPQKMTPKQLAEAGVEATVIGGRTLFKPEGSNLNI